jgi:hypothetical protein
MNGRVFLIAALALWLLSLPGTAAVASVPIDNLVFVSSNGAVEITADTSSGGLVAIGNVDAACANIKAKSNDGADQSYLIEDNALADNGRKRSIRQHHVQAKLVHRVA